MKTSLITESWSSVNAAILGDCDTAIPILLPYAEQGSLDAQNSIGGCYFTSGNNQEAVKWFHKAALQGYAPAQSSLGIAYITGLGVSQDYKEAFYWLQKAAVQGSTIAQYNLGLMYFHGHGIPQAFIKAYFWSELAVEGYQKNIDDGFDMKKEKRDAKKNSKLAAKHLTRFQKKEVKKMVDDWKSKER
jgi:TPR repeat protein